LEEMTFDNADADEKDRKQKEKNAEIWAGLEQQKRDRAIKTAEAIIAAGNEVADAIGAGFDRQIDELNHVQEINDAYYDGKITQYEGDEAAQEQFEQMKRDGAEETQRQIIAIQRKQAAIDKVQALFSIAISTAKGIMAALGLVIPNPVLAAAIGVAGAVQAATVAATPLPQYRVGLHSAQEDHLGIVGDDPSGKPEAVNYPDGSTALFSTPTVAFLPKYTSVDTASETAKKLQFMDYNFSMNKLNETNKKQVKYLSLIAKNTMSRSGQSSNDTNYINKYLK